VTDSTQALSLVVAAIAGIWGIYQTRVTSRLQQEIEHLRRRLDRSVQDLDRVKELTRTVHEYQLLIYDPKLDISSKHKLVSKMIAVIAELHGLVHEIGDSELEQLTRELDSKSPELNDENVARLLQPIITKIHARASRLQRDAIESPPTKANLRLPWR
jgi:transposase